jgi:hypothetical protein
MMPDKPLKRPRDPAQLAKLMIDIASGEVSEDQPTAKETRAGKAEPRAARPAQRLLRKSVRMYTRRFNRLTNAFSKKVENHAYSVALFAMYYNFVRVHKTLRVTPATAANVTKRL